MAKSKAPRRAVVRVYRYESDVFKAALTLSCGHKKMWLSDERAPATSQCRLCEQGRHHDIGDME